MPKARFSSLDVAAIVSSLRSTVLGYRISNVYDINPKTYLLKLAKPEIYVEPREGKVAVVKADYSLYESFALGPEFMAECTLHKGERAFYDQAGPMPTPSLQFGFRNASLDAGLLFDSKATKQTALALDKQIELVEKHEASTDTRPGSHAAAARKPRPASSLSSLVGT